MCSSDLEGASATLAARSRIALIGPNGAGKSTMIRMILEQESPDEGRIVRFGRVQVGHLAQEPPALSDQTVLSEVLRLGGVREALLAERTQLEETLAANAEHAEPAVLDRYAQVMERLEALDEYRLESRARAILGGMGFSPTDLDRPLRTFSGGWLMRVALARLLLQSPDVLLLDEPTNHLDLESLLWLEDFLQSSPFATLTITHDRVFLQRVSNRILELNRRYANGLLSVKGDYVRYLETKDEMLAAQAVQETRLLNTLRRETEWLRRGAKARTTKQQARIQRHGELTDAADELKIRNSESAVRLDFQGTGERNPRRLVEAEGISLSYENRLVVPKFDLLITPKSRIGLLGPNGSGKSSLIRLLLKLQATDTGLVKHAEEIGRAHV